MKEFWRLLTETDAAEVAELALVLPLLFTVILAIFSFGRAFNVYSTLTRAAQEGARVAVTPACAYCGAPCGGGSSTGQFPCDTTVVTAVSNAMIASHLDVARIVTSPQPVPDTALGCPPPAPASPSCTKASGSKIWVCRNILLTQAANPPACGTVVSFQYSYELLPIPFFSVNAVSIPARAQMRVEY